MSEQNTDKEMDKLKEEINRLREDLASLVDAAKAAGFEKEEEAKAYLRSYRDRARSKAEESAEAARHEIEERPFTSMLTAFGIGFVVGMLLDRRR